MFWNKKKKEITIITSNENPVMIEDYKAIYYWFLNYVFNESAFIVEQGYIPSKLYLKHPIKNKDMGLMHSVMTSFGELKIITDPDMKEILRVE